MKKWWFNSMLSKGKGELEYRCWLSKSMESPGPIKNPSVSEELIRNDKNKNIHSSSDSDSSSYSKLAGVRDIHNFISDDTFFVKDSNRDSYSIYFDIENPILELDNAHSFLSKLESSNSNESESSNESDVTQKYRHLWVQCENCYGLNYKKFLYLCEQCGYHLKMISSDRIDLLVDPGTWDPMDDDMVSIDPIEFDSEEEPYKNHIDSYQSKTGLTEAVQTGTGQLNGIPIAIGVMDFQFMGWDP